MSVASIAIFMPVKVSAISVSFRVKMPRPVEYPHGRLIHT
jgi:hypothetical protein